MLGNRTLQGSRNTICNLQSAIPRGVVPMDNAPLLLHDQIDGSPTLDAPPTRDDAIQQRVHELESQAQSYLARPTNANFKQAIGLYERILGFGDINPSQRAHFERRLDETLH